MMSDLINKLLQKIKVSWTVTLPTFSKKVKREDYNGKDRNVVSRLNKNRKGG